MLLRSALVSLAACLHGAAASTIECLDSLATADSITVRVNCATDGEAN